MSRLTAYLCESDIPAVGVSGNLAQAGAYLPTVT
jgi:hypothetical protein